MRLPNKTQVLIIGSGPVGMVLALLLHNAGIRVVIVDKRADLTPLPRAIAINQATLGLFERLGLENILQQGLKVPYIQLYWKSRKIGKLEFQNTETPYPYFFHIQQSTLENCLEQKIKMLDIPYYRSVELMQLYQSHESVKANLHHNEKSSCISCQFMIGADGGQSKTRELIGSPIIEENYGAYFILADVIFKNDKTLKNTHYYFLPEGYLMLVPIANKQTRVIFSFKGKNNQEGKTINNKLFIQNMLATRMHNAPEIRELIWVTQANFGHRLSQKILAGRVVLVGDALHQFSPVGGTNMNVGLQDADSLFWRIRDLIKSPTSSLALLKDYARERELVIKKQQYITEYFTALMTRTKLYPKDIHYTLADIQTQLLGLENHNCNLEKSVSFTSTFKETATC